MTTWDQSTSARSFYLMNLSVSMYNYKLLSHNNMTGEYWPNGQHRIQPLTCGQCSKITITVEDIAESADSKLFKSITHSNHCLHFLLPPVKDQVYSLRPKSHPYQLSSHKTQLHRRSFIPHHLFRSVYQIFNFPNLFHCLVSCFYLCIILCSFSFFYSFAFS